MHAKLDVSLQEFHQEAAAAFEAMTQQVLDGAYPDPADPRREVFQRGIEAETQKCLAKLSDILCTVRIEQFREKLHRYRHAD